MGSCSARKRKGIVHGGLCGHLEQISDRSKETCGVLCAVDNDRNSRTVSDHGLTKPFELKYKPNSDNEW